jgi:hypothetical protein
VHGRLVQAVVLEQERSAVGVFEVPELGNVLAALPMDDLQLAAWRKHPETYFGVCQPPQRRKVTNWLEMAVFFHRSYRHTPRDVAARMGERISRQARIAASVSGGPRDYLLRKGGSVGDGDARLSRPAESVRHGRGSLFVTVRALSRLQGGPSSAASGPPSSWVLLPRLGRLRQLARAGRNPLFEAVTPGMLAALDSLGVSGYGARALV